MNVPQNLDAEQAVLGAIMVESELYELVAGIVSEVDFHLPAHATIFLAFGALRAQNKPIEKVSLAEELIRRKQLDEVGGVEVLTQLLEAVATTASTEYYAAIVAEKSALRRLQTLGAAVHRAASDAAADPANVCRLALDGVRDITERASHSKAYTLAESLKLADEQGVQMGNRPGIPYAPESLHLISAPREHWRDRGMNPRQITVIGARPKIGKSTLMEILLAKAGIDNRVLFFALEMGIRVTLNRMMDRHTFSRLKMDSPSFKLVDNDKVLGIEQIAMHIAQQRPDVAFIDQAKNLRGWHDGNESRDRVPTRMLYRLREIATQYNCHLVIAQQIGRGVESNESPTLKDLRDTGAFEEIADRVVLLHRPHYGEDANDNEIVLDIKANRHGAPGHTTCIWNGPKREIIDRIASVGVA
jgi:replicative DNA helicase